MCGEEKLALFINLMRLEIPPRVRRRGRRQVSARGEHGNTSACAEKSDEVWERLRHERKYLRVCGEEYIRVNRVGGIMEIPPRVRRRVSSGFDGGGDAGNTSACAEKSGCVAL